jgi:uncharacterized protein YjbI with pentapeptide repeats
MEILSVSLSGLDAKGGIEKIKAAALIGVGKFKFCDGSFAGADLSHIKLPRDSTFWNCDFNDTLFAFNQGNCISFQQCELDQALFYNGEWEYTQFFNCSLRNTCFILNRGTTAFDFRFFEGQIGIITNLKLHKLADHSELKA